MNLSRLVLFLMVLCSLYGMALPQTEDPGKDEDGLEALLEVLDSTTEIATRTNMNSDYVPGFVTVLDGQEMYARGARTVYEALELAPGIQMARSGSSSNELIARGLGKSFLSGKYKIMVNGHGFNSGEIAAGPEVFTIPIILVDRIELIRGPASALYGEFALTAVVNVVTKTDSNRITGRYDPEMNAWFTGGNLHFEKGERLKIDVNFGFIEGDGPDLVSGPDRYYNFGLGEFSLAPGKVNTALKNRQLMTRFQMGESKIDVIYFDEHRGDHYGLVDLLKIGDEGIKLVRENLILSYQRNFKLPKDANLLLDVGARVRKFSIVDGLAESPLLPSSAAFPDGKRSLTSRDEVEYRLKLEYTREMDRHTLVSGIYGSHDEIVKEETTFNYRGNDPVPLYTTVGNRDGVDRRLLSAYLQDSIRISSHFTLTLGARFDDYDISGSNFTPRLAGVFFPGEEHIFKFQYAEAFRPPTLGEYTANPELHPEDNRNFEMGYTWRRGNNVFRSNLFFSRYEDQINRDGSQGRDIDSLGTEVEWETRLGKRLKLVANGTLIDVTDRDADADLEDVATWIGNLSLTWKPNRSLVVVGQARLLGDRARIPADTRDDLDGWKVFDLIIGHHGWQEHGFTVQLGCRNLFDEDIRYPSSYRRYAEDYPRLGRDWSVGGTYKW